MILYILENKIAQNIQKEVDAGKNSLYYVRTNLYENSGSFFLKSVAHFMPLFGRLFKDAISISFFLSAFIYTPISNHSKNTT